MATMSTTYEFVCRIRVINHVFVMNVAMIQTTKWMQLILFCIGYHIFDPS